MEKRLQDLSASTFKNELQKFIFVKMAKSTPKKTEKKYLDMNLASEYTCLSKSYLYKLVEAKKIPHRKLGHKILFSLKEIDKWLDSKLVSHK